MCGGGPGKPGCTTVSPRLKESLVSLPVAGEKETATDKSQAAVYLTRPWMDSRGPQVGDIVTLARLLNLCTGRGA
jgi:hypothetical protein